MAHCLTQSTIEPQVLRMLDLVSYQESAVVSRVVLRKKSGIVTFDEGQGLSEHTAPFDAIANLIEGDMEITISGLPLHVKAGEFVVMPTNQPHALKANAKSKMLLIMIRSQD